MTQLSDPANVPIAADDASEDDFILALFAGRRASVHWNLQRKLYSIKVSGQPVQFAKSLTMRDCTFFVDPRLRNKFTDRPTCRTVHALIRGEVTSLRCEQNAAAERVVCNPFQFAGFRRQADGSEALNAREVILDADKRIFAVAINAAGGPLL